MSDTDGVARPRGTEPAPQGVEKTSAFLDFLYRSQGSLPEVIGESDLETLNAALAFLFAHLREAQRQFRTGDDYGRSSAHTALGGIWQFVALFDRPLAENLQVPILHLSDALVSLDNNHVEPVVKPTARTGRARSSHKHLAIQGAAAGTVSRLTKVGLSPAEARKAVAKQLTLSGVRTERGSGNITAHTVRNWCEKMASDVGRRGTAAMMHDSMFVVAQDGKEFPPSMHARARCDALAWLDGLVRVHTPSGPAKSS
jgi:hypothetical protein